jgi:NTP pyrophosphatase (non-canonical NTP hydrolase)
MRFEEYQLLAGKTAIYPREGSEGILYTTLGLTNEAGEVAGKVKKVLRDNDGLFTEELKAKIGDEVGDVLWYCAMLCQELGISLNIAALQNLEKLRSRNERGVLKGDGDKR